MKFYRLVFAVAVASGLLSACGGGGQDAPATPADPPVVVTPPVTPPVEPPVVPPPPVDPNARPDWVTLADHCATPRTGDDAAGFPYPDLQGTLTDEMKWLRSYYDETYLWYREIPADLKMSDYARAVDYFAVLKTPAITASGRLKDQFHFTYPSAAWDALSSAGVELGYGLTWVRSTDPDRPRIWNVTMVEPGSPADLAGMRRGDSLAAVDGIAAGDTGAAAVAAIYAAMAPTVDGETHLVAWSRDGATISATLKATKVAKAPVKNAKVLDTPTGKVGYLQFNDHNAVAESQLVNAIAGLKSAGVGDLVLDMRYNGGGLLSVASELAYMIAGPQATAGKVFERPQFNDKTTPQPAQMFQATALGYAAPAPIKRGTQLPYLNLKRVTILTTPGTCSASEAVINSLRGVDVEVNLVGGETCGKPYAFLPAPNCGTTYFAIQLQGTNDKGFGDYADGFQPTCAAADDLSHALGDPAEGVLAAALSYRANGACPPAALRKRNAAAVGMRLVRPEVKEIAIRNR
jgi:hypothetical protein